jgi:hypothetical protein
MVDPASRSLLDPKLTRVKGGGTRLKSVHTMAQLFSILKKWANISRRLQYSLRHVGKNYLKKLNLRLLESFHFRKKICHLEKPNFTLISSCKK